MKNRSSKEISRSLRNVSYWRTENSTLISHRSFRQALSYEMFRKLEVLQRIVCSACKHDSIATTASSLLRSSM